MKINSKSNIPPVVAKAAGTPRREQTKNRCPAQGLTRIKTKANIKPAVAKAAGYKPHPP
jgi:hypothetical protein